MDNQNPTIDQNQLASRIKMSSRIGSPSIFSEDNPELLRGFARKASIARNENESQSFQSVLTFSMHPV